MNRNSKLKQNRLKYASSPYLIQHATNPVDWYEWEEGLIQAKKTAKPILLSIGYAACHWCHVMQHESFDDAETAKIMNKLYISIKVDREERPDLDSHYQTAIALLTGGRGGWPLTVFCTPEGLAFAGGTYFPKNTSYGLPSFKEVLQYVHQEFSKDFSKITNLTERVLQVIRENNSIGDKSASISYDMINDHIAGLMQNYDKIFGGFGSSGPKFPQISDLRFLLTQYYQKNKNQELLTMVTQTFDNMVSGGIYDQLASGFHRYSVDRKWFVPHFEKMLYDNAQFLILTVELYQITKNLAYKKIALELVSYLKREIMSVDGVFYSSQDADSEGKEGKYFIWTKDQIINILGDDLGKKFCKYYDVTDEGNFEDGYSILNKTVFLRSDTEKNPEFWEDILTAKETLLEFREKRPKPFLNTNIIVAWNALVITALTKAGYVLNLKEYVQMAKKAFSYIIKNMKDFKTNMLYRSSNNNQFSTFAFSEDYSLLIQASLELFAQSGEIIYFNEARKLQKIMDDEFWDETSFGYFLTSKYHTDLGVKIKPVIVFSLPSANAVSLENLIRLYHYSNDPQYLKRAEELANFLAGWYKDQGYMNGDIFMSLDYYLTKPIEFISFLSNDQSNENSPDRFLIDNFIPHIVILRVVQTNVGKLRDLAILVGRISQMEREDWKEDIMYVCKNMTCSTPLRNKTEVEIYLSSFHN
ncbi:thioredoxin domain-containing protein [Candidatus Hodarchaeum mangrovi]